MTNEEYFFYEWLLIEKKITAETYKKITQQEYSALQIEYQAFSATLRGPSK